MSWKDFLNNKEEEQPQKEGRGMDQKSVAKPPVLFSETQQVLKEVEAKLGGTLITYYNSNAGSVCGNDASAMYEILKDRKRVFVYQERRRQRYSSASHHQYS